MQILWQSQAHAPHLLAILMAMAMLQYSTIALTYELCSALQFKPLDSANSWVFALYCLATASNKLLIANKCISLAGHFDGHGNAPVQYQAHWPMCRAQRFNLSYWTPQLVKYWPVLPRRLPGSHKSKQKNTIKWQNKHWELHTIAQAKKDKWIVFCTSQGQTLPPKLAAMPVPPRKLITR